MDLSRLGSVLVTRWGAATDTGPVRRENQDSWLAAPPLFAVADGMSGHEAGAAASSAAVRAVERRMGADALGGRRPDIGDVDSAIEEAALAVSGLASASNPESAPGTTLTGVLAIDSGEGAHWLSFNVGDSRTCLVAGGSILRLTKDHSAIQEARDRARETGEEGDAPPSNVVTRALGAGFPGLPEVDYTLTPLHEGDVAVLCSDGVHGAISDAQILDVVMAGGEPQEIANGLVDAAINAGTRDNATAVVVRVDIASTPGAPAVGRDSKPVRPASARTAPRADRFEDGE